MTMSPNAPRTHAVLLAPADPLLLDQDTSWKITHFAASAYSPSAGQGGNLIRAHPLCRLTCTNFRAFPAVWSPSVLWHTPTVSQSNTNIDNQAKPISSILTGLWWGETKETITFGCQFFGCHHSIPSSCPCNIATLRPIGFFSFLD